MRRPWFEAAGEERQIAADEALARASETTEDRERRRGELQADLAQSLFTSLRARRQGLHSSTFLLNVSALWGHTLRWMVHDAMA
jgi:hypothetical protein